MVAKQLFLVALALLAWRVAADCDSCDTACTAVAYGIYSGDTTNKNISNVNCLHEVRVHKKGAWYKFMGTGQTIMAALCDEDTDFDTMIAVWAGHCSGNCTAYDDDGCGEKRSSITFNSVVGVAYYIFVTGFGEDAGYYALSITPVEVPTNVNCWTAKNITDSDLPYAAYEDTSLVPLSPRHCGLNGTAKGLWYKFTGHGHHMLAKTCDEGTIIDTTIDVYFGATGAKCAADGSASTCLEWNDDSCGVQSEVTFYAAPTFVYWIFVHGYGSATGRFLFELEEMDPNVNSRCTRPVEVENMPFIYRGSTASSLTVYSQCGMESRRGTFFLHHGEGKWIDAYTCDIDNTKTTFDTVIDVYAVCNDDATLDECVGTNDDFCLRNARVRFFAENLQEYYIYVAGYHAATEGGNYTLTVEPTQNETNTQCWRSHQIDYLPFAISQSTDGVDASLIGCDSNRTMQKARWYTYTHTDMNAGTVFVDTSNDATTVPTRIVVHTSCDSTKCIETIHYGKEGKAFATFPVKQGTTYHIAVFSTAAESPDVHPYIHTEFELNEDVAHGRCDQAITAPSIPFASNGYSTGAVLVWSSCAMKYEQGQWFTVTGTGNKMAASTCSEVTDFDTGIDVYGDCRVNSTCIASNDDFAMCGVKSKVTWYSVAGQTYKIYVHGYNGATGVFLLQVYDEVDPANSKCSGATKITELPYTAQGINTFAVPSNGTCHDGVPTKAIWYVMDGNGYNMKVSTCHEETEFDTMIDVYQNCINSVGHNCVDEVDSSSTCQNPQQAELSFPAYSGSQYYIAVTHAGGALEPEGFFELRVIQGTPIFPEPSGKGGLSSGAKAGIAIGVIAGVGAAGAVVGFIFYKRRVTRADYAVIS